MMTQAGLDGGDASLRTWRLDERSTAIDADGIRRPSYTRHGGVAQASLAPLTPEIRGPRRGQHRVALTAHIARSAWLNQAAFALRLSG
jgi:hypothetical protein